MDNNVSPTPQFTPEAPAGDNPAPAAEPVTPPTPEPVAQPTPTPEPVVPPSAPADVNGQPKKKGSGAVVWIILGSVLLLGIIGAVIFYFLSHSPEKLVKSSIDDLLRKESLGMSLQINTSNTSKAVGVDTFIAKDAIYLRGNNLDVLAESEIASSMVSVLGTSGTKELMNEIGGKWWKLDSSSNVDTVVTIPEELKDREKIAKAWKEHMFIKGEKVSGMSFPTSGDAFKLTVDKQQFEAFSKEVSGDSSSSSTMLDGPITSINSETTESTGTIFATIKSSLFGGATITGIYLNTNDADNPVEVAIDLEHAAQTAPTDAKDVSELTELIQQAALKYYSSSYLYGYGLDDYDYDYDYDYDEDWDWDLDYDYDDEDYDYDFSSLYELMDELDVEQ